MFAKASYIVLDHCRHVSLAWSEAHQKLGLLADDLAMGETAATRFTWTSDVIPAVIYTQTGFLR